MGRKKSLLFYKKGLTISTIYDIIRVKKGDRKMKATGIVRRIDDLGRVVIPKEIRRSMGLREGDPLELFVEGDSVCFVPYRSTLVQKIKGIGEELGDMTFENRRVYELIKELIAIAEKVEE